MECYTETRMIGFGPSVVTKYLVTMATLGYHRNMWPGYHMVTRVTKYTCKPVHCAPPDVEFQPIWKDPTTSRIGRNTQWQ